MKRSPLIPYFKEGRKKRCLVCVVFTVFAEVVLLVVKIIKKGGYARERFFFSVCSNVISAGFVRSFSLDCKKKTSKIRQSL